MCTIRSIHRLERAIATPPSSWSSPPHSRHRRLAGRLSILDYPTSIPLLGGRRIVAAAAAAAAISFAGGCTSTTAPFPPHDDGGGGPDLR
jgi:hypothetical protein